MSSAKAGSDKSAPQTSNKSSGVAAEEAEGSFQCGECMGKITIRARTRQSSSVMKQKECKVCKKMQPLHELCAKSLFEKAALPKSMTLEKWLKSEKHHFYCKTCECDCFICSKKKPDTRHTAHRNPLATIVVCNECKSKWCYINDKMKLSSNESSKLKLQKHCGSSTNSYLCSDCDPETHAQVKDDNWKELYQNESNPIGFFVKGGLNKLPKDVKYTESLVFAKERCLVPFHLKQPTFTETSQCDCEEGDCTKTCVNVKEKKECSPHCKLGSNCKNNVIRSKKWKSLYVSEALNSKKGLGLFANEKIKKKDFIVEYTGYVLDSKIMGSKTHGVSPEYLTFAG